MDRLVCPAGGGMDNFKVVGVDAQDFGDDKVGIAIARDVDVG